jgi:hypothetical protein
VKDEPKPSLSVYDYSDKSIQHAWIAVLAYLGLRVFGTVMGILQQTADIVTLVVDAAFHSLILGVLAFGIYRKSRTAVMLAILWIVGWQLYVWIGLRSFSGTVVSVIVTGFLLRGARRIFEHYRDLEASRAEQNPAVQPEPDLAKPRP